MIYLWLLIIPVLAIVYFKLVFWFRDLYTGLRLDIEELKEKPWLFGKDFLWGSATAAYQVEGNCTNNNWYRHL